MARCLEETPSPNNGTIAVMRPGRIPHHIVVTLVAMLCGWGMAHAQPSIGGVVNQYVSVIDVIPCDSTVVVGNPSGLGSGDLVFLIQMKGASIVSAEDSTFGTIVSAGSAGNCEFLTIERVDGDKVIFTTRMANAYQADGIVQLIKVPRHTNARITQPVSAPRWNGTIGGVVVIAVEDTLIMDADIVVDGAGFAGGNVSPQITQVDKANYFYNWIFGFSGEKGEGIARNMWPYPIAGRGKFANGGGGGNGTNAGGGGGSNYGRGGEGGWATYFTSEQFRRVGGLPGQPLDSLIRSGRLFLGGGGGGAQQNDAKGSAGGAGGGLVVIRAKVVHGRGKTISARGLSTLSTPDAVTGDGTGGGGAGGTVLLDIDTLVSALTVVATGGSSGDILSHFNPHGPGGGGGGGAVVLRKMLPALSTDVRGGSTGKNLGTSHGYTGLPWGATTGDSGAVVLGFAWKKPLSIGLHTWGGGPFCGDQSVVVTATPGFSSYRWSNGDTSASFQTNTPGEYTVVATDPSGCVHASGPIRVWENSPQYDLVEVIDFGKVDYRRNYIRTITLTNRDDEDIVVTRITQVPDVILVAPTTFPVTIPANGSLDIAIRLFTSKESDYLDTLMVVIGSPCPDTGIIILSAEMNLVEAFYDMPDTTAFVGSTGFGMPITLRLLPDSLVLPATAMTVSVSFDSRIYSPTLVTAGRIVSDIIDVVASKRRLTITIDSVDLVGPSMTLTTIVGTVLNSYVTQSPFTIESVEYHSIFQYPINHVDDGLLVVSPVCFQQGRQIRVYGFPKAEITPNPAAEITNVEVELTIPGTYVLTISNDLGQMVERLEYVKTGEEPETRSALVNVARWPSGAYSVVFSTPLTTMHHNLIITR